MAQTIKVKRSAVAGKAPATTDLELGELGLNTYDGKLYAKKDNGTESIVELSGVSDGAVTNAKVASDAAIAGTKISPDFGSQNVTTTGTATAAALIPSGSSVPTNGVYLPAANNVAISTNGVQRINIEADGDINIDGGGLFYDATNNRLGIGTNTADVRLHVRSSADDATPIIRAQSNNATQHVDLGFYYINYDNGATSSPFEFRIDGTQRMALDASGRLLVGTSSRFSHAFEGQSYGNSSLALCRNTNNDQPSYFTFIKSRGSSAGSVTAVWSNDLLGTIEFLGADGSDVKRAAAIDCRVDGTPGANDMPGTLIFSTTADGASNTTERMRITNNGTILIGTTNTNPAVNNVNAGTSIVGGFIESSNSNEISARFNRRSSDGNLVEFRQDGTAEGTISVSGTTVSYNGAHLSRWSQLAGVDPYDKTARPEILRGTVMSNLDEMCDWICPTTGECQDNEQLNKTEISSIDDDPNVAGVFQSWDDDDDTWVNDFYLAMTGDFVIRIAAGTTVQRGDLLCSAGDGTARPQGDRYIKDSTIAKVTSTTVSCTHPDGSYCVPCVLMAC